MPIVIRTPCAGSLSASTVEESQLPPGSLPRDFTDLLVLGFNRLGVDGTHRLGSHGSDDPPARLDAE